MNSKIFAVIGATSDVGKVVVAQLENRGYTVRRISRMHKIDLDDKQAMHAALEGVDGVFAMLPFDMTAADLHIREAEVAKNIANAIRNAGVRRVVTLSTASAHLKDHTGSGRGGGILEEQLDILNIPELIHLRAAFFMENFIKGMNFAAQVERGAIYASSFKPDRPLPMIAAKDIGMVAADILSSNSFDQPRVRELLGAKTYTMEEATKILAAAYGKPEVKYVQSSYEDTRQAMINLGVSASFADAVVETAKSFNCDDVWWQEERSPRNTTTTTLEEFAKEYIKKDS